MISKITGGPTKELFSTKVLNKYDVKYYQCEETGFIQTEEPFWLNEAYSSAITKLDIGLPYRNENLRELSTKIISQYFDDNKSFLDYAGGYGLFTRLMRDKGYDFYHADPYCKNIFAEHFDLANFKGDSKFELVTSFEVFEHLVNPMEEIKTMLNYGNNLLFSTVLQPEGLTHVTDWWYFIPETGQHISLYTIKSLEYIAQQLGYHFYTDYYGTHLFTQHKLEENPFQQRELPYLIKIMKQKVDTYFSQFLPKKESLLDADFNYIKSKIQQDA